MNSTFLITRINADRYRIEDSRGWCEFTYRTNERKHLSSFGGSLWPDSWPNVFILDGPDKGQLTGRTFYALLSETVLEGVTDFIECAVHLDEPCGKDCNAECDNPWHHRKAVTGRYESALCQECCDELFGLDAAERAYASGYAHACGYMD